MNYSKKEKKTIRVMIFAIILSLVYLGIRLFCNIDMSIPKIILGISGIGCLLYTFVLYQSNEVKKK